MTDTRKQLTGEDKVRICAFMASNSVNGRSRKGARKEASEMFGCDVRTINRVLNEARSTGQAIPDLKDVLPKTSTRGRKKTDVEKLQKQIRPVHMSRRRTYRSLSKASKIPRTTLWRARHRGDLKRHHSSPKPLLTR